MSKTVKSSVFDRKSFSSRFKSLEMKNQKWEKIWINLSKRIIFVSLVKKVKEKVAIVEQKKNSYFNLKKSLIILSIQLFEVNFIFFPFSFRKSICSTTLSEKSCKSQT